MSDTQQLLALDDLAFVESAYALILGRAVDPKGLHDYLQRLQQGTPKARIVSELQASDEGRAYAARRPGGAHLDAVPAAPSVAGLLGIVDDAEFVERGHLALTGQRPTPAQAAEALERLADGGRRVDLLRALRRSPAGAAHRAALDDVHTLDLTADELAHKDRCSLARLLAVSDEAFVHLAYHRLLGRDPDASGRANYLSMLRDGTPRLKILLQLQTSAEGVARGARVDGLEEALAPLGGLRQRLAGWLRAVGRATRAEPPAMTVAVSKDAAGASAEASMPAPHRTVMPARHESVLLHISRNLSQRLAAIIPPHLETTEAPPPTSSTTHRMNDISARPPAGSGDSAAAAKPLSVERFIGPYAQGWAVPGGSGALCSLSFGDRVLGRLTTDQSRPDVKAAFGLETDRVGFAALLGGLLQFSALAPECASVQLEMPDTDGAQEEISLAPYWPEALTFSPLKALARLPAERSIGKLLSIDFAAANDLALMIETSALRPAGLETAVFDVYQEQTPGHLARLGRFSVEIGGQIIRLEAPLLSRRAPVLLVATDAQRHILLTDCIPLPELHAESQRPLLDYHSVLTGGQAALDVATKIGRAHLDAAIRHRLSPATTGAGPSRETTCVLLYARENYDFLGVTELRSLSAFSEHAAILEADGGVRTAGDERLSLAGFIAAAGCRYALLLDIRTSLRPDFWAVLEQNRFRAAHGPALLYWHSIWLDGVGRPHVAKPGLLLHPALTRQALLPLRAALVAQETLAQALAARPKQFRSGSLQLEQAFCDLPRAALTSIPIVLDSVVWPLTPMAVERYRAEHLVLPALTVTEPRAPYDGAGVSVIINHRNSPSETIRCLQSLRSQVFGGSIEVVLVDNCSSPENSLSIRRSAQELFGADAVRTLDYAKPFNHSAQCNLGAKAARHDLLLMLSNDSVFLSENAVDLAAVVTQIPWVATAGFRIVGGGAGKRHLQSLGLGMSPRHSLFEGGAPLATQRPPPALLEFTQEALGNTFAAVMIRREVYFELGGLDEEAFPTNYNDVDFCCRALQQGYRHVSIGAAVVEHVGRGSREMDLDLPIDQRILERCPDLSLLTSIGLSQL